LDDLGKGRMSPTAEELLFDIIDHRTERKKPILWTSNCTDQQLHSMLSVDRADAILRRLSEFTKVISL
jgi:DNA replication protein DnaC